MPRHIRLGMSLTAGRFGNSGLDDSAQHELPATEFPLIRRRREGPRACSNAASSAPLHVACPMRGVEVNLEAATKSFES